MQICLNTKKEILDLLLKFDVGTFYLQTGEEFLVSSFITLFRAHISSHGHNIHPLSVCVVVRIP